MMEDERDILRGDKRYANLQHVRDLIDRCQQLEQIIDALFELAEPGPVKNALWQKYQNVGKRKPVVEPLEGTSGM